MKYIVSLNGKDYEVEVEKGEAILVDVRDTPVAAPAPAPAAAPAPAPAPAAAPAAAAAPVAVAGTKVEAPLPGVIIEVKVSQGQAVKEGDVLFVVEAMKMANDITAPCSGTIAQVAGTKNQQLNKGDLLAVIA